MLWKRTFNGVEYGLGSIPLGGFVQLPQMGPMGGLEGNEDGAEKLPQVTPLDKIIVAFAGPLFSFLLAVFFAVLVFWVGKPDDKIHTTQIGWVVPGSPGEKAGLLPGDTILKIDGTAVHSWNEPIDSVIERIAFSSNDQVEFLIQRPGQQQPLTLKSGYTVEPGDFFQRRGIRRIGIANASLPITVNEVLKGSAADRAGLKKGDIIEKMNGQVIYSPEPIRAFFDKEANASASIDLAVVQDGKPSTIKLTGLAPKDPATLEKEERGYALTGMSYGVDAKLVIVHPAPSTQLHMAATMMVRTFAAMGNAIFRQKGDLGPQQLGSPIKILSIYSRLFGLPDGWKLVFWFSVILNVNLALMNLLPFPVLDGGHIVMAIGEWIGKGSLLPIKIMEYVQTACVLTLLGFFVYVAWFDANDLARSAKTPPPAKVRTYIYP